MRDGYWRIAGLVCAIGAGTYSMLTNPTSEQSRQQFPQQFYQQPVQQFPQQFYQQPVQQFPQQPSQRLMQVNLFVVPVMHSEDNFALYDLFVFDESGRERYSEKGVAQMVEGTFEIPIRRLEEKVPCFSCHDVSLWQIDTERTR